MVGRIDPSRSVDPIHTVVNEQKRTYCIVPFIHWIASGMG